MRTTGAVAPSGRQLARALAEPLRARGGAALTVLEAGPGTGSVTRALIPALGPGSHLDAVEPNPRFAARLRHLVQSDPGTVGTGGPQVRDRGQAGTGAESETGVETETESHCPARPRNQIHVRVHDPQITIHVHETFVERLDTDRRYDVIVSGLPFTNFTPEQVELIMERYLELLRPGGTLTYFAYLGTSRARRLLASRSEVARHLAVERLLARYQCRHATGHRTIWGNVPPARVWQLRAPHPSAAPHPLRAEAGANR
ncbi:translation initiation factor IF-2 [Streptomyces sp. NPDC003077]|uniref:class I SAM-dependent methyltransferase n=1 Tax=Streptomyces sp. NPDC003077 TaxID=3154443 RepID=UPI0033A5939F